MVFRSEDVLNYTVVIPAILVTKKIIFSLYTYYTGLQRMYIHFKNPQPLLGPNRGLSSRTRVRGGGGGRSGFLCGSQVQGGGGASNVALDANDDVRVVCGCRQTSGAVARNFRVSDTAGARAADGRPDSGPKGSRGNIVDPNRTEGEPPRIITGTRLSVGSRPSSGPRAPLGVSDPFRCARVSVRGPRGLRAPRLPRDFVYTTYRRVHRPFVSTRYR